MDEDVQGRKGQEKHFEKEGPSAPDPASPAGSHRELPNGCQLGGPAAGASGFSAAGSVTWVARRASPYPLPASRECISMPKIKKESDEKNIQNRDLTGRALIGDSYGVLSQLVAIHWVGGPAS
jgi:hypothetical protein